jgi:ATP-binding cassette subfamily B protein/subfamily B ATP-binding cassette protein MsbA
MLVSAGLNVLKPWPVKLLVDSVAASAANSNPDTWMAWLPRGESPIGFSAWIAAATLVLFAAGWGVQTLHAYIQSGLGVRMSYGLGAQVFDRLQRLSLRFHSRRPAGDLVRRVTTDSRCARDLVIDVCLPAQTAIATLLGMTVVMAVLDWSLTILSYLVAPPLMLVQRRYYKPIQQYLHEQQEREGALLSEAEQTLSAIPAVQTCCAEQQQADKFRTQTDRTLDAYFRSLRAQLTFRTAVGAAASTGRAAVMLWGGYRALEGHLTPGDLLVFLAYQGMLYQTIDTLANLTTATATAHANAQRVFEVLDSVHADVHEPTKPEGPLSPSQWRGAVEYRNVTFAYDPDMPVLRNVTLSARPGEVVALVGPTGAGKTTLVSLLLRFFDPCEGCVLIDGVDARQISLSTLRGMVSIVMQDSLLLPVTVAENISYGQPTARMSEIEAAADAAHATDFIRRLPKGFDTVLGERGATLSGGEAQRIAIARAFLKASPLLVLDEPTSALDSHSEATVVEALQSLTKNRTCFVIAHRLSTIKNADRLIFLEDGRIKEVGSYDELMSKAGRYSQYVHGTNATVEV